MELMETLRRRRSIRRYKEGPVPEEQLEQILTAALLAPTSMDRKPCRFHVIEDRETLNALSSAKRLGAEMLQGAGAAIVVAALSIPLVRRKIAERRADRAEEAEA